MKWLTISDCALLCFSVSQIGLLGAATQIHLMEEEITGAGSLWFDLAGGGMWGGIEGMLQEYVMCFLFYQMNVLCHSMNVCI